MSCEKINNYIKNINKKGVSTVISAILTHIVRLDIKYI
jgi:hypothetical protein